MAKMIPSGGPNRTNSYRAEPDIYWRLSKLNDTFTVIHSLPWLSAAVKTIDKKFAPTGELDFIVLHPELGILAIEVKGGRFKFDRHKFVYIKNNQEFDPISQLRRGTFALSKWIQSAGIYFSVGYAWIFPDVDMKDKRVPPAFQDISKNQRLAIDHRQIPDLENHIIEIMEYWKETLGVFSLSQQNINKIVDLVCPSSEYDLGWDSRVEYDNKTWLTLTEQQERNLKRILEFDRTVVSGRPGTGKTILAIALARYLAAENKKILFLLFNSPIRKKIECELNDLSNIDVFTFHSLCGVAESRLNRRFDGDPDDWFTEIAPLALQEAINKNHMGRYDALIIDEGQIFRRNWYSILQRWISNIHVFCDETQAFPFEERLTNRELVEEVIDAEHAGTLTVNLRSPKTVFERLVLSLPTDYEQYSPRHFEKDTLTEIVSFNPQRDLLKVLKDLADDGLSSESIAVITKRSQYDKWSESNFISNIETFSAVVDTSSRLRGLEFPIVVVYNISVFDKLYLVNAYARATTAVIAIYSLWDLKFFERHKFDREPFFDEILKDPLIYEAVNSPWEFMLNRMGWEISPVITTSAKIYWNHNLRCWFVHSERVLNIADHFWLNHLLMSTEFPVFFLSTAGLLGISKYELSEKSFLSYLKLSSYRVSICEKCGKFSIEEASGDNYCANCVYLETFPPPKDIRKIQKWEKIVSNPQKFSYNEKLSMGLSLLALAALNNLNDSQYKLLLPYVEGKNGNRLGYHPLLVLTGIDVLNQKSDEIITLSWLRERYKSWTGLQHHDAISKVLPDCTNYWLSKNWLDKVDKGKYRRVKTLPPYPSDE